jgi:glycosyltransferase involved in cell wall biosynthesis
MEMLLRVTKPIRVLGFGTYDPEKQPRIQVLLDGLSEAEFEIDTLNAPLGYTVMESVRAAQSPLHTLFFAFRVANRWTRLIWGRFIRRLRPNVVIVGYLAQLDVLLARVMFPRTVIAIDYLVSVHETAIDRRITGKLKTRLMRLLDRIALAVSDVVIVDTEERVFDLGSKARSKAVVVPVGATREWFGSDREGSEWWLRPFSVIFFGLFTPLQGAPVIAEAVRMVNLGSNEMLATFVGRGQDYDQCKEILRGVPGVIWKDWLGIDELRTEVLKHHVCFGIFGTTPKAQKVAPTKGFQAMASGRALLTADMPAQRRAFKSGALYVPAGNAADLASALRNLHEDRDFLREQAEAARAVAEEHFLPIVVIEPLRRKIMEIARLP